MDFYEVVSTTRAMRRLDPDRPVPPEALERALRAGTLGPSGGNSQPVRWLVVSDADKRAALGDIYLRASEGIFAVYRKLAKKSPPDPIAKSVLHLVDHFGESPTVVIPCTRIKALEDPDSFFPAPWDNPLLTLASTVWPCVQNFCLAARAEGLGATPTVIHNILEDEVRTVLGLPDDVHAWCLLPVGYPTGRWGTPTRRALEEVTFSETWGTPWEVVGGPELFVEGGTVKSISDKKKPAGANGEAAPLTARGQRTRMNILTAARAVFERDGFVNTRVSDIADEANVAVGSFYNYFTSKEEVFRGVISRLQEELIEVRASEGPRNPEETVRDAILRANRRYLETWHNNTKIMKLWEQVAILDEQVEKMLTASRTAFVARAEASIRDLLDRGVAHSPVDPHISALALTGMISRFAYVWFTADEHFDMDTAADQLTTLWTSALGLDPNASLH